VLLLQVRRVAGCCWHFSFNVARYPPPSLSAAVLTACCYVLASCAQRCCPLHPTTAGHS
jgi:hypothetical protein